MAIDYFITYTDKKGQWRPLPPLPPLPFLLLCYPFIMGIQRMLGMPGVATDAVKASPAP